MTDPEKDKYTKTRIERIEEIVQWCDAIIQRPDESYEVKRVTREIGFEFIRKIAKGE